MRACEVIRETCSLRLEEEKNNVRERPRGFRHYIRNDENITLVRDLIEWFEELSG